MILKKPLRHMELDLKRSHRHNFTGEACDVQVGTYLTEDYGSLNMSPKNPEYCRVKSIAIKRVKPRLYFKQAKRGVLAPGKVQQTSGSAYAGNPLVDVWA